MAHSQPRRTTACKLYIALHVCAASAEWVLVQAWALPLSSLVQLMNQDGKKDDEGQSFFRFQNFQNHTAQLGPSIQLHEAF